MRKLGRSLSYANVMATVAVFLALGGGAFAATSGLRQGRHDPRLRVEEQPRADGAQDRSAVPTRHVALTFNAKGARGARGPAGATGPAGPAGPAGPGAHGGPRATRATGAARARTAPTAPTAKTACRCSCRRSRPERSSTAAARSRSRATPRAATSSRSRRTSPSAFRRSVSATPSGNTLPAGLAAARADGVINDNDLNLVDVVTRNTAGTAVDLPFNLSMSCPQAS